MCGNIACAVSTLESEEEIPEIWRAEELSKLEGPKAGHPGRELQRKRPKERPLQGMLGEEVGESCVVEYDDECDERDYCVPEDEGATAKGDYVSLVDNPERFTGYAGPGARQVWDAIYRENCFLKPLAQTPSSMNSSPATSLKAADDFRNILQNYEREHPQHSPTSDELLLDDDCIEKRVFHRLISGMHASISTHICWDYFNQLTGEWLPNVECYKERLHDHPERISNLYFNYALVARAVTKIHKHLQNYTFCSTQPSQDLMTKHKILELTSELSSGPYIFDEKTMFQDPSAIGLKEDFRNRFRNVSRLMDCIGCDKCRLWGKLQTAGYGAALKVLFEFDETKNGENPPLRRTELVALINTLGRISKSVSSVRKFRTALESGTEESLIASAKALHSQPLSSEPPKDGTADEDIFPDTGDDENHYNANGQKNQPPVNIADEFWSECSLIWRAFKYIISSWLNVPRTLYVPKVSTFPTVITADY
jgi:ERO1-like protein beta